MKRYPLLFILLFALAAGVMLSGSAIAGEKCCVRNDKGVCVPCPEKGTSATATTAGTQQQACCPSGTASKEVRSHSDHRQPSNTQSTAVSNDQQKCCGKVCVPCKPGEKCDGKPCKPGDCRMSEKGSI